MTRILDRIDRPQDLQALSEDELQQVAQEVRELLIDTVGEIGGHFGANLGTCEIAVAAHSLMDSPTVSISSSRTSWATCCSSSSERACRSCGRSM